jgi:HEAT repeat protein
LAHLQDEAAALSPAALSALSGASPSDLATFRQVLSRLPVSRRRRASQMLIELAEENLELDFNALFRSLLDDGDAEVRAYGIAGLWEDEDPALAKMFVGFLRDDPDAGVRAEAANALGRFVLLAEYGRIKSTQAELICDALLAVFRDTAEDIGVRCRAVESLAYSSQPVVHEVITTAYADDDARMCASAVLAMGRSADAYWCHRVEDELESPEPRMRFEAARAAGELEDRAAVPRLIELLDDADREVASAAITALGQIGGKSAQRALTRAAASDDEMLSALADEALQELEFAGDADLMLMNVEDETLETAGEDEE